MDLFAEPANVKKNYTARKTLCMKRLFELSLKQQIYF